MPIKSGKKSMKIEKLSNMKISKIRSLLYSSAKLLGDFSAVKNGRILKRLQNRIVGKLTSKYFRKWRLFK